ncbi:MAG: polysaccharide deacetylase family protein [Clostridia bacterium]|nr:polysaccharide deacetylase family protein [Clostridia bacterium]
MYNMRHFKKENKPYKFVTLSFDDCVTQDIRFAELLRKYDIACTFNLNSAQFGWTDILPVGDTQVNHFHVKAEDVKKVYDGFEAAAHSKTHPRLDMLTKQQLIDEIKGDAQAIEELTGQHVIGMAYPGGPYYNDFVIETIKETTDIVYSRDTKSTHSLDLPKKEELMTWQPTGHFLDERIPDIIEELKKDDSGEDRLLYIWGHTYEFDLHDKWDYAEELLSKLSGLDGVTYATNGEIAEYIINER